MATTAGALRDVGAAATDPGGNVTYFGYVQHDPWWCCGPIGLLTGPSAIGTGIFALVQIKNDPTQYAGKPLAIIGIATGGLFLLLWVLFIVIWGIGAALGGLH